MCTKNIWAFLSWATTINSFLLMSSTFWRLGKAFVIVYLFHLNSFFTNYIFALEKMRKDISKIIFILVLANKKVSSKN